MINCTMLGKCSISELRFKKGLALVRYRTSFEYTILDRTKTEPVYTTKQVCDLGSWMKEEINNGTLLNDFLI